MQAKSKGIKHTLHKQYLKKKQNQLYYLIKYISKQIKSLGMKGTLHRNNGSTHQENTAMLNV